MTDYETVREIKLQANGLSTSTRSWHFASVPPTDSMASLK